MQNNLTSLWKATYKTTSKVALFTMLGCASIANVQAQAQEGNWLVRVRAVHIDTANKSEAIPSLAVPNDAIHVSNKTIPELDITYFFTKNWATELVLTYPQKHDVTIQQSALGGPVNIGTFKHLPPTLSLQYHFLPEANVRPYVGVGLNYTRISSVKLNVPTVGALDLSRNSFGLALGAGVDFKIDKNLFLNLDIKKVKIDADVKLNGAKISKVKVDPWLIGVGVGYRF